MNSLSEANELWIRMMKSLTDDEILSMESSRVLFYSGMVRFLSETPYVEALNYAKAMSKVDFLSNGDLVCRRVVGFRHRYESVFFKIKMHIKSILIKGGLWGAVQRARGIHAGHCMDKTDLKRIKLSLSQSKKIAQKVTRGSNR